MADTTTLRRTLTLPFLILYGLGTMVGGGFYALIGKVAGEAGMHAPVALALSGLLALVSALSYAELSSRFPVSAGEARYVREGLRLQGVATGVGLLVILTGIVSSATLAVATIGFVGDLVPVPHKPAIAVLVLLMGLVAAWGVGQSVAVVTAIAVIEVGALLVAILLAGNSLGSLPARWTEMIPSATSRDWIGIFAAAFLAFYAFIGFEDLVNMAEEVKHVRRNLPIAIMVSVVLTTLLYLAVAIVGVLSVPPSELGASNTPVAEIVRGRGWYSTTGVRIVSVLAGLNGALVQIIMASRVAYGLAKAGHAPAWLAKVHPRTRTPLQATAAMTAVILLMAIFLGLTTLAKVTSGIILVVYAAVNWSLWLIKGRHPERLREGPTFPRWIPLAGTIACVAVLLFQGWMIVSGS